MSFEHAFVEQAEYLESEIFSSWHASHPDEDAILRKLCHGGAKRRIQDPSATPLGLMNEGGVLG